MGCTELIPLFSSHYVVLSEAGASKTMLKREEGPYCILIVCFTHGLGKEATLVLRLLTSAGRPDL